MCESFVSCFPYTAVAALLPGESLQYTESMSARELYLIERANNGHGYVVTTFNGTAEIDIEYFATAREVRERLIGSEPCAPLVAFN